MIEMPRALSMSCPASCAASYLRFHKRIKLKSSFRVFACSTARAATVEG
jgi:hypothetical protein